MQWGICWLKPWLKLRFDYDTTTIRLRRIARACFHSTRFDASKNYHVNFCRSLVVVVGLSQSNRYCDIGFTGDRSWHVNQRWLTFQQFLPHWKAACVIVVSLASFTSSSFRAFVCCAWSALCDWSLGHWRWDSCHRLPPGCVNDGLYLINRCWFLICKKTDDEN